MPLNSGFVLECSRSIQMTDTAQFHTVDVDADGFDPLAQGLMASVMKRKTC